MLLWADELTQDIWFFCTQNVEGLMFPSPQHKGLTAMRIKRTCVLRLGLETRENGYLYPMIDHTVNFIIITPQKQRTQFEQQLFKFNGLISVGYALGVKDDITKTGREFI